MGQVIDLDAISAARREAKKERPSVRFGGEEFELPAEMPFAVVEAVGRLQPEEEGGQVDSAVIAESMADIARSLFGKKFRKFLDLGPSVEDIMALLEHVAPAYGLKPGESEASES